MLGALTPGEVTVIVLTLIVLAGLGVGALRLLGRRGR